MKQLHDILIKILGVSDSEITDEMSQKTVQTWDSFNGLVLLSEIELAFGVKFTMEESASIQCVGDIKNALRLHGVVLEE